MNDRIKKSSLLKLVSTADQAAAFIKDGMTVAMSGWAMAGYPKAVPQKLVKRKQAGEGLSLNLITGANVPWLDELLGSEEIVARRAPMVAGRALSSQANKGSLKYVEQQMCQMPKLLKKRSFGKIDVAVVEALGFDAEGRLIPTSSLGMTHYLLEAADKIVVEINSSQPEVLASLIDIHIPAPFPDTQPIPLVKTSMRIGDNALVVDEEKICCIVETDIPERMGSQPKGSDTTRKIAENLFAFLEREYGAGAALPPVQLGFGGLADSLADAFAGSDFKDLQFFCGGVTEPVMELLASGRAAAVSTGGIGMTDRVVEILENTRDIEKKLVIRNGDISNSHEVINRLGLIALNTGIEIDIYGNVNSSHISGNRVVYGIGGGAGFAQAAGLSVMMIPSAAKGGAISGIVPMVSHQDITDVDIDIVVTENGVADLRGLDDGERADLIIANCASEIYREQLSAYLAKARRESGGHHPQLPEEAFAWHRRLKEEKTMLEKK